MRHDPTGEKSKNNFEFTWDDSFHSITELEDTDIKSKDNDLATTRALEDDSSSK
ncbi:hypothetical protein [Bacillus sp. V5-8f]|uniref:hypothetical protein n=1 Tax=Bacillus sp. V5-8f TaxID=2053044 RepID=UPI0015E157AC|nr:hypothetical protein [Bacillus sp. V5-8f]